MNARRTVTTRRHDWGCDQHKTAPTAADIVFGHWGKCEVLLGSRIRCDRRRTLYGMRGVDIFGIGGDAEVQRRSGRDDSKLPCGLGHSSFFFSSSIQSAKRENPKAALSGILGGKNRIRWYPGGMPVPHREGGTLSSLVHLTADAAGNSAGLAGVAYKGPGPAAPPYPRRRLQGSVHSGRGRVTWRQGAAEGCGGLCSGLVA